MSDGPLLHPVEMDRIREGIAAAVLGAPDGLAESLEHDAHGYLRLLDASRVGAEEAKPAAARSRTGGQGRRPQLGHGGPRPGSEPPGRPAALRGQDRRSGFGGTARRGPNAPKRRTLGGLTAFNEMAALEEAGRDGWHVVGYGPFFHEVEASDHPWEHCRIALPSGPRHRRMESEGWIPVGAGWFPWRYYKRPVNPGA